MNVGIPDRGLRRRDAPLGARLGARRGIPTLACRDTYVGRALQYFPRIGDTGPANFSFAGFVDSSGKGTSASGTLLSGT